MPRQSSLRRRVAVSILSILICGAFQSCGRASSDRLNVVLIVVDTLRADRLGCYGWHEPTSPNVDALASSGVLFEKMVCQAPQTLPSFCTILTGSYPRSHGVRANGIFALPDSTLTMAEMFRENGYGTAAFIGGFPLDARFGLGQGFDEYFDEMKSSRPMEGLPKQGDAYIWMGQVVPRFENTADVVTDEALRWLGANGDKPFFVMIHYFDPHHDYSPPARFAGRFEHPYAGEVAFADEQIGRVLRWIEESGNAEETLVAFTGDHGECLGEYGRRFHQQHLNEDAIHVPFILRLPRTLPAGKRIDGSCESVDIMPTLLELAGIAGPASVQGTSLVASVRRGVTADEACYFSTLYGKLELNLGLARRGVLDGDWKLIRDRQVHPVTGATKVMYELYNLAEDPGEEKNLAKTEPPELTTLRVMLDQFIEEYPERQLARLEPDPDALRRLKSLGYLQ